MKYIPYVNTLQWTDNFSISGHHAIFDEYLNPRRVTRFFSNILICVQVISSQDLVLI